MTMVDVVETLIQARGADKREFHEIVYGLGRADRLESLIYIALGQKGPEGPTMRNRTVRSRNFGRFSP